MPCDPDGHVTLSAVVDDRLSGQGACLVPQGRSARSGEHDVGQELRRVRPVEGLLQIAVGVRSGDIHRHPEGDDERGGEELPPLAP